jgi:hypothetical protein
MNDEKLEELEKKKDVARAAYNSARASRDTAYAVYETACEAAYDAAFDACDARAAYNEAKKELEKK